MLLSIVMMVKNEEKYLDKTLSSLQNLMNDINSELIILDTGSTDKSIEIARKYTDKVYFEKWNNNFADMRNISISYANGEWILVLDADEVLINYDKLKKFFNSNLHKRYNSATIEIKNIANISGDRYSMVSILRLFKNEKNFVYYGAIHEKPKYKEPIYNNIVSVDHYGYMYEDEEIKQLKYKRNINLLLNELKNDQYDAYTNYQLGKTYMSLNINEALCYMEKSWKLYKVEGRVPIFVTIDLLSIYSGTSEFTKCEKLASKYIEEDKNNIDVYYYLALSQKNLYKYEDSIKNYERYLYLLENYEKSTQANSIECQCYTSQYKEMCNKSIIENYYKLEMYDKVVENLDLLEEISDIYYIGFDSLYKLNLEEKILELYNKYVKTEVGKSNFTNQLEKFFKFVRECDKNKTYKILSNIEGNYGVLNKIRLGESFTLEVYNNILKTEYQEYYGEALYYALKNGFTIEKVLEGIDYNKIQGYIDYLIKNKRDIIIDLYNYLVSLKNTLNTNKICIYSALSKSLVEHGNLFGDKYENLFLLYIKYNYNFIKSIYNNNFTDEEILSILNNKEDIFALKLNIIQKNKSKDLLKYISNIKSLLNEYKEYKNGIEILINKFNAELNESEELKKLKSKYKLIIENSIGSGSYDEAISMIKEYENMFNEDIEILNMKAIISIYNNRFEEAESYLKESLMLDINNYNTIFNIAYLKECIGDIDEAIRFYKRIILNCEDETILYDAQERINCLKQ